MRRVGIEGDPNLLRVQAAFAALDDLANEVVLVGGCAAGLLVTSVRAQMIRPTRDIDVVVEVVRRADFQRFEAVLRGRGFTNDQSPDAPICRWRRGELILDVMPNSREILGFGNSWYPYVFETAERVVLPNQQEIRLVSAPVLLLAKFEAFRDRGAEDLLFSHDLEDIVTVLDARDTLEDEIAASTAMIRESIAEQSQKLLEDDRVIEVLQGFLPGDRASQDRLPDLIARFQRLAGRE
jgi:predicted nucleotidyltransferase